MLAVPNNTALQLEPLTIQGTVSGEIRQDPSDPGFGDRFCLAKKSLADQHGTRSSNTLEGRGQALNMAATSRAPTLPQGKPPEFRNGSPLSF